MNPIYCLNGPNLNQLGTREPEIYGLETLSSIEHRLRSVCETAGASLEFRQTNSEGTLVDWVQEAGRTGAALVLNAGAYTHTSIALHDALKAVTCPKIEVHLSNPAAREPFRHTNFVAPVVHGSIAGLGASGYVHAIQAAIQLAENSMT